MQYSDQETTAGYGLIQTLLRYMPTQWRNKIATNPLKKLPRNAIEYSLTLANSALFPPPAFALLPPPLAVVVPVASAAPLAVAPVVRVLAVVTGAKPNDVKGTPLEMVEVVWQFDEAGMEAGPLGVRVSPTV